MSKKLHYIPNEDMKKDETSNYEYAWILADELRRSRLQIIVQYIALIILFVVCLFFLIRNPYKIHIAEIRESTGEVLNTKELTDKKIDTTNISERQINYFLSNFITNTRTVTFDKDLYQKNINRSNFFLTKDSQKQLANSLKESDVLDKISKGVSVNIVIKNFNKIENNKYQVTWEESYIIPNGGEKKESYLGIFIISTVPVKDQKMILNNPLGLVITNLSISNTQN